MIVGIDAGGTKTDLCLGETDGTVLDRRVSAGINASRMGAQAAAEALLNRIRDLGLPLSDIEAVYAGVAGALSGDIAARMQRLLEQDLSRIQVASDAFNALNAQVGNGDGIALIAGTGSSAFARFDGEFIRCGGLGPMIDDAGSGCWLGRLCLDAVGRSVDGRGVATALTEHVQERMGGPLYEKLTGVYEGGYAYLASFAPLVFACAEEGDAVALELEARCVRELALLVETCRRNAPKPINLCVAGGGLFRSERLCRLLREVLPEVGIVVPDVPPVCGTLLGAACLLTNTEAAPFRARFRQTMP